MMWTGKRITYRDLVRENLKDLKLNCVGKSKQLNYRLSTFPYRKFIAFIDYKFYERGLNVVEVDARATSITCPVCNHTIRGTESVKKSSSAGGMVSHSTPNTLHA